MSNPKKILFILHFPPPMHGAAKVGLLLKESKTVNNFFNTKYINLGLSRSVNEIGKNPFVKISRYLLILYKCLINLFFFKPELCYFTLTSKGLGFYKDIPIIFLIKLFNVKIVYHLHNKGVNEKSNKFLDDFLYSYVFKNSFLILLSNKLYSDIKKYVDISQVYYCPNGIPKSNIKADKHSNKSAIFNILFLSNLIESKGAYILLEACRILKTKQLNFYCTYVGGIGDISEIDFNNKIKEFGLISHVQYLGKRYGIEKNIFLNNSDILVLPSLNDCFPLVLLEAMQFYLPVISTIEGGIPDIIQDKKTGYLVSKNDIITLTEKIEFLINNPELKNDMGIAANKRYKENYTLEIFEKKIKDILNNI